MKRLSRQPVEAEVAFMTVMSVNVVEIGVYLRWRWIMLLRWQSEQARH